MARIVDKLLPFDLSADGYTNNYHIHGARPFSIQPTVESLAGNPTYTLEVSNDGINFIEFDKTTTKLDMTDQIQSNYSVFPWEYFRLAITSNAGSGTVIFKIWNNA